MRGKTEHLNKIAGKYSRTEVKQQDYSPGGKIQNQYIAKKHPLRKTELDKSST